MPMPLLRRLDPRDCACVPAPVFDPYLTRLPSPLSFFLPLHTLPSLLSSVTR